MEKNIFLNFASSSQNISENEIEAIENITKEYPYFQLAKAIYLKGLKQNNNFKYNKVLKETAALTTDRAVLFDYITDFDAQNKTIPFAKTSEKIQKTESKLTTIKHKLELGKPLEFAKKETHSFTEWLQLSATKPIQRGDENLGTSKLENKLDLIDLFIENNPSIQPIDKEAKPSSEKKIVLDNSGIMTETLAKVYLEQKKYSNAIKAYEILILKYPEKSGFFADQIKNIEYIKTNKS
ncbi:tetratricopeptide repeat protein [Flavicella sediminum]|uniref:tetratricopeptide repeat protein n=1 Tax=Flavicella sediminum TaxID=2585141 RepID=UPI001122AAB1|nr:tetratricopeptide repeat protein [Flavicella sediminum]